MWTKDLRPGRGLEKLGLIAARLARIVLYQKLGRGEAQLRAAGIDANIVNAFKAQALRENVQFTQKIKEAPEVKFTRKGRTDF